MSYCVVFGCNNRTNKKNYEQLEKEKAAKRKFSFHMFPRDVNKKNKWLETLNLENYDPPKTAAVCSEHFKEENYEQNHLFRKLKKDAIPHLSEERITCTKEAANSIIENIEIYGASNENNSAKSIEIATKVPTCSRMVDRSTSISPERLFNSPTKTRIRKIHACEIKCLKKKIYQSNYNQKKMETKLQSLKNVLKDLQKRNLLTPDEGDILQHMEKDYRNDDTI